PVLLNLSRKAFGRQVSLASPRSQTGRAFTELAYTGAASLGEGSHVVLVAGATPGPGASVVAANLAAALARTHSEAVLVCADTRDSVAPKLFGLAGSRGLAGGVAGGATAGGGGRGPAGAAGGGAGGDGVGAGYLADGLPAAVRHGPGADLGAAPGCAVRGDRGASR